jgi:NitT/TauT family transport system substrate-binding protein
MKIETSYARRVLKDVASLAIAVGFLLFAPSGAIALGGGEAAATSAAGPELRVGVFLDSDSIPLLVAAEEGLFEKEGVKVRLLAFQNPVERDAALQAGAVDGVVSDLLAAGLASQAGFGLRVTSLTDGRYGILSAPGSGITELRQLKGVEVAISTNSIIHYATETMLADAGVSGSDVRTIPVPKMPVRLELLLAGQVKAACLPEPLLSAAKARGATLLAASDSFKASHGDDSGLGAGVILFTKQSLDGRLDAVKAFYRAYAAACVRINAGNDAYRPFLASKVNFPAELTAGYRFVTYKKPRLPSEADLAAAFGWLKSKGLLKADIPAEAILDGRAIAGL